MQILLALNDRYCDVFGLQGELPCQRAPSSTASALTTVYDTMRTKILPARNSRQKSPSGTFTIIDRRVIAFVSATKSTIALECAFMCETDAKHLGNYK